MLPRHKAANWVGSGRGRKTTRPGANGVVELSPFDFLDRLSDLMPSPRKHRHRYLGVFAPSQPSPQHQHSCRPSSALVSTYIGIRAPPKAAPPGDTLMPGGARTPAVAIARDHMDSPKVLGDDAPLHHEFDPLRDGDVVEWVARHGDDVGCLADRQDADVVSPQQFGGHACSGTQGAGD